MKIFLTIAAIMSLVLMSFLVSGAPLEEASAGASVTVNEFVDITLTDAGATGFAFGSLDPSTTNNKEANQIDGIPSTTPAATVTRETTSNVDVLVRLKGTDFGGAGTIAISNAKYDDDGVHTEGSETNPLAVTTMTTSYGGVWATLTLASPDVKIWFWLDIPASQAAGPYSSTFSFEGNSV